MEKSLVTRETIYIFNLFDEETKTLSGYLKNPALEIKFKDWEGNTAIQQIQALNSSDELKQFILWIDHSKKQDSVADREASFASLKKEWIDAFKTKAEIIPSVFKNPNYYEYKIKESNLVSLKIVSLNYAPAITTELIKTIDTTESKASQINFFIDSITFSKTYSKNWYITKSHIVDLVSKKRAWIKVEELKPTDTFDSKANYFTYSGLSKTDIAKTLPVDLVEFSELNKASVLIPTLFAVAKHFGNILSNTSLDMDELIQEWKPLSVSEIK